MRRSQLSFVERLKSRWWWRKQQDEATPGEQNMGIVVVMKAEGDPLKGKTVCISETEMRKSHGLWVFRG